MIEEQITMSNKELTRLELMAKLDSKRITQQQVAKKLGVSTRHVRRLYRKFLQGGAKGLLSQKRGKPSNHQLPATLKTSAADIIRENYADFGPTLATEYLLDRHEIKLSTETVRQLMIANALWQPKIKREQRIHQQRERRARFGELIQLDGSHHDWFEGRAGKCCLLVLVDDATSAIVDARFFDAETTQGYLEVLTDYFESHGLPMALYSDKHGVFKVNAANCEANQTQVGRALDELGVELICAHSPQAKGRVERANRTLQDRLIKSMRVDNVSSMEEGNAYLTSYIQQYNKKFAKAPRCEDDVHCPVNDKCSMRTILSVQSERKLSKALELSHNTTTYQLTATNRKHRLCGKTVKVCEHYSGEISLYYGEEKLNYKTIAKRTPASEVHDDKTLNAKVDKVIASKPCKKTTPAAKTTRRYRGVMQRKKRCTKTLAA